MKIPSDTMKRNSAKLREDLELRILTLLDTAIKAQDLKTANLAKHCLRTLQDLPGNVAAPTLRVIYVNDWQNPATPEEIPEGSVTVKMRLPS